MCVCVLFILTEGLVLLWMFVRIMNLEMTVVQRFQLYLILPFIYCVYHNCTHMVLNVKHGYYLLYAVGN